MNTRKGSVVGFIGLLAMLLAACSGGGGASPQAPASGATFNVVATEFAFNPNTFKASVGQPITFKITNNGQVDHTFVIMGLDGKEAAKASIKTGATETLQFTPTAAGDYPIICNLAGHKDAGMTAMLSVK